jgi:hypothetical protein
MHPSLFKLAQMALESQGYFILDSKLGLGLKYRNRLIMTDLFMSALAVVEAFSELPDSRRGEAVVMSKPSV